MAIKITSDCNSCPDCVGCSLGKQRKAVFCDSCRMEIDAVVYIIDGEHRCADCALESLESFCVEDVLDGFC